MKEKYTVPEVEIIEFEAEDVITTSWTKGNDASDFGGDGNITF